jgi:hypothetical protein
MANRPNSGRDKPLGGARGPTANPTGCGTGWKTNPGNVAPLTNMVNKFLNST